MRFLSAVRRALEVAKDAELRSLIETHAGLPQCPVTIAQMIQTGRNWTDSVAVEACRFLHREFQIRISHMIKEIESLPTELSSVQSVQRVHALHLTSLEQLHRFGAPPDESSGFIDSHRSEYVRRFGHVIEEIMERHASVTTTLANGIREMRQSLGVPVDMVGVLPPIQAMLDRFYLCRIGIRMLGSHYVRLLLRPPSDTPDSTMIGVIDRRCNVTDVARTAADDATMLCQQHYGTAPEVVLNLPRGDVRFAYPPSHLHFVFMELLKNALRATAETHQGGPLPPVVVTAVRSQEDISIKIADQGGGIPRKALPVLYSYTFTTAHAPREDAVAPIAGYGYGLPLARLYARYFGGDVRLMSMDGFGTDAFVFLKASGEDALEVLPEYQPHAAPTPTLPIVHAVPPAPSAVSVTMPAMMAGRAPVPPPVLAIA